MRIFSCIIALLFCTLSNAQNTSPYWSLAGNNNSSLSNKIGTTNNVSLRFVTNNIERVKVLSTGNVGIGTSSPAQKLHVAGKGLFAKGVIIENGGLISNNPTDLYGISSIGSYAGVKGMAVNYGIWGESTNRGVGVVGRVNEGGIGVIGAAEVGVRGTGDTTFGTGVTGSGYLGVYGLGRNKGSGVMGESNKGVGVSGMSSSWIGVYGQTNTPQESYAGYFNGDVYSGGTYQGSDSKLKQNVADFSTATAIIGKLKPKVYEYKHDGNYELMNLPKGKHYGFIAQEVELILPELVKDSKFDVALAKHGARSKTEDNEFLADKPSLEAAEVINFKAVNYTELIPVMVKAMQEQQQIIESQSERIEQLEALVSRLVNGGNIGSSLSNAFLGTASPNPVKGTTIISYSIPEENKMAHLLVTDIKGSIVKQILLNSLGNARITLNTAALAAGTYTYSLHVDGSKVDSKQLLIVR